jgi:hypothetical protein
VTGASVAQARTLALADEGLTVFVPKGWGVATADGVTRATSPNQEAAAVFLSRPIRDRDLAYQSLPGLARPLLRGCASAAPSA